VLRPLRGLPTARSALAGIEFALILPFLLTVLAGLVDLSLGVITARRLTVAAADVALVASTMAVQSKTLNALSGQQAWQATTTAFAIFPAWRNLTGSNDFSITLSAVDFAATPAGCTVKCAGYAASTRWSVANQLGQVRLRACGALAAVPDGQQADMTTLPAGVFGPTSVLIGDVATVFVPLLTGIFVGPVPMMRSTYVPPRLNNGVQLTSLGPGQSIICPIKVPNSNE